MGLVTVYSLGTTVSENIFADEEMKTSPDYRRVVRVGIVGSAAIADCAIELYYGKELIGTFYNTTAGANITPKDDDMQYVSTRLVCRPGVEIRVVVIDVAVTNAIYVTLDIKDYKRRGGYRRRA